VPLVILGGPAGGSTDELCTLVAAAVAAGARGITIGRRVWQRPVEEATEVLSRLAAIVHPERTVTPAG
jgi:fructose-bisphosphate aldolase, class I